MYKHKKVKLCRKVGEKIFPNVKVNESVLKTTPGVHGDKRRSQKSEYGKQLLEKQKVKYIYGLREKQFRKCYNKAILDKGSTPLVMLNILETRLDSVIYRAGIASTMAMAKQMILHGHIAVNGSKVTISSYVVKVGDKISLTPKGLATQYVSELKKNAKSLQIFPWMGFDEKEFSFTLKEEPTLDSKKQNFDLSLVVQFYSR
jgi:small subunit ribosomal protein S4